MQKGTHLIHLTDVYEQFLSSLNPAGLLGYMVRCDLSSGVYREVQGQVNIAGCVVLPQGDGL